MFSILGKFVRVVVLVISAASGLYCFALVANFGDSYDSIFDTLEGWGLYFAMLIGSGILAIPFVLWVRGKISDG